jgi:hypothetical protein
VAERENRRGWLDIARGCAIILRWERVAGSRRRAIGRRSTLRTILGDAIHRRPGSRGLRFVGVLSILCCSASLSREHEPAPAAFDQVAKNLSPAGGAVLELASQDFTDGRQRQVGEKCEHGTSCLNIW